MIIGKPRDADDHVQWLLEQGKPREALEAATESASKNMLRRHSVTKIGNAYLNDLVQSGDFGLAARQCQKLLKQDTVLWERWVHVFNMHEELAIIAPFIPVKEPQLRPTVYEMVLSNFLDGTEASAPDHEQFFYLLEKWPPGPSCT